MSHHQAAVWIDHKEAKVFHVTPEASDTSVIKAPNHHVQKHSETTREHDHPADQKHYYHAVAKALSDAHRVLIVGPGTAKLELIRHLHAHDPKVEKAIVGVETVDHPTGPQIAAYVRHYFHMDPPRIVPRAEG